MIKLSQHSKDSEVGSDKGSKKFRLERYRSVRSATEFKPFQGAKSLRGSLNIRTLTLRAS